MLGISLSDAQNLAERGQFSCGMLWTSDGYRVTLAALIRVLRKNDESREPGPEEPSSDPGERKDSDGLGG
jgi:hypothetical protein